MSAEGGEPRAVTTLATESGENSHRWPRFLPDGRSLLFLVQTAEAGADDDRSRDTIDGESRRRLFVAADRARRNLHCRVTRRIERHNALFVQT